MTRTLQSSHNLVDVIESVLGFSFSSESIENFSPSSQILHGLALAVQDYYEGYQVPHKKRGESRPYVFRDLEISDELGMNFEYKDDPRVGDMTRAIKKCLLYSHGLCIHDPLPYLLDYFRINPDGEIARSTIPKLKALLLEYAGLEKLIREGILIPLNDAAFGRERQHLSFDLSEQDTDKLKSAFPNEDNFAWRVGYIIRRQQYMAGIQANDIDLFFPNVHYVKIYRELSGVSAIRTGDRILEPYYAGILLDISGVNPDLISIEDMVSIRKASKSFEDWRHFLKQIFRQVRKQQEKDTVSEKDWSNIVQSEWVRNGAKLMSRSSSNLLALHHHLLALGIDPSGSEYPSNLGQSETGRR